eukprot:6634097-Pyramimonas_sp.AAC.1
MCIRDRSWSWSSSSLLPSPSSVVVVAVAVAVAVVVVVVVVVETEVRRSTIEILLDRPTLLRQVPLRRKGSGEGGNISSHASSYAQKRSKALGH